MDILDYVLGVNYLARDFLFYESVFKKGNKVMPRQVFFLRGALSRVSLPRILADDEGSDTEESTDE